MKQKPFPVRDLLPDNSEANRAGCKCPRSTNLEGKGTIEGDATRELLIREFTIHPDCVLHSDIKFWLSKWTT